MPLSDPPVAPEPGEGGSTLRAKELKNRPLIIQPIELGSKEGADGKTWEYVSCNVWVLDRQGVETYAEGVRFSWWRAREQLKGSDFRSYVACRPVEQDDNSVVLAPLQGDARQIAEEVVAKLESGAEVQSDDLDSPF